jgi:hypothetical protein
MDRLNSYFLHTTPTRSRGLADFVYSLADIAIVRGQYTRPKATVLRQQSDPITTTNLQIRFCDVKYCTHFSSPSFVLHAPPISYLHYSPHGTTAHIWALSSSVLKFIITHTIIHTVGLLDDWSVRRRGLYLHRTTQHINAKTNIHALSGIRTRDPSNQAANTCALDRGHWDRLVHIWSQ